MNQTVLESKKGVVSEISEKQMELLKQISVSLEYK